MKILADATLPHVSELFSSTFATSLYHSESELMALLPYHEILLCRSTLKVNAKLLSSSSIQCVATASSGIDHIDTESLHSLGIKVFDAKGCNANAVADYVIASLAYLVQNNHVNGKRAGVIGIGEVGSRVVERLLFAGFEVTCFDPIRSLKDNDYTYCDLSDLFTCDLLCVHPNLHNNDPHPSFDLLNSWFLTQLKPGTCIINASRGGIIDEESLLEIDKPLHYCTDVYYSEPLINPEIIRYSTLCTAHIAGHTIEAKMATMIKLSRELHQHYDKNAPKIATNVINQPLFADISRSSPDILACYNPIIETLELKHASDKTLAFLMQRQNHQFRHDLNFYFNHEKRLI